MDYKRQGQRDSDAQMAATIDQQHAAQIENRLKEVHTCLPGIIVSFDSTRQTAVVQPSVKRIFTEQGPVNLPLCVDVPVKFPGGGGYFLTFPVKPGDECVLQFSERAIDYWYANGGVQLPFEYRMHDLSDAFADVGVNSQPNRLSSLCTTGAELRTRDGETFVRIESGTITFQGNVTVIGSLSATKDISTETKVTAQQDVTANGTSLHTHKHSGVQAGGAQTGTPV